MAYIEKITVAVVDDTVKSVHCEKCNCDFHYRMVRRGEAYDTPLFASGRQKAALNAERKAKNILIRSLRDGVEAVACPKCGWYQAEMNRDARSRFCRWMVKAGWSLIILSLATTLLTSPIWSQGFKRPPWGDDWENISLALTCTIPTGVALLIVRNLLARRINLNVRYPERPDVLPGTPEAWIDEEPRRFDASPKPAPVAEEPSRGGQQLNYEPTTRSVPSAGWIPVQLARVRTPPFCCHCMGPPQRPEEFAAWFPQPVRVSLNVCGACVRRYRRNHVLLAGIVVLGGLSGAIGMAIVAPQGSVKLTIYSALIGGGLAAIIALRIAEIWLAPVRFRRFSPDRNVVEMKFKNPSFAYAFSAANTPPDT